MTGEPFPRKCPDSKGNRRTFAGCMVVGANSYCLVQRTGIFTEMGSASTRGALDDTHTSPDRRKRESPSSRAREREKSLSLSRGGLPVRVCHMRAALARFSLRTLCVS